MALNLLLQSLMMQWNSSKLRDTIVLHAYVVDTDISSDIFGRQQQLQSVINGVNSALLGKTHAKMWLDPSVSSQAFLFRTMNWGRSVKNYMYGYDDSEILLNYFKQQVRFKAITFVSFLQTAFDSFES